MRHTTTIGKLKKERDIDPQSAGLDITEDKKIIIDNLQDLLGPERKMFVERKYTLYQNI